MKVYKLDKSASNASKSPINYEQELNESQREVVFTKSRASLVLAGPGAGKTRVLVYRVAHLIESQTNPENILLLTFTNKAAKEMMRRVEELVGYHPKGLVGGTFHHIGNLMLRRHAPIIEFSENFSIIDMEDSRQLIKDIIASIIPQGNEKDKDKQKHFPSANVVHSIISFASNAQLSIKNCIEQRYANYEKYLTDIERIAKVYEKRKRDAFLVDFDDLLVHWNKILDNDKVRSYYQKTFKNILVDEFQDTNKLQFEIIRKLTQGADNSIMAVGDDCQSIYSFRAAEIQNILNFPKWYKDYKEYKLETNYRSTPQILNLVNQSIKHNKSQFKKTLITKNKPGTIPALVRCSDTEQEASFITQRILELKEQGIPYGEMGVLFRAEYQSAEVELELMKKGIPFQKRGGLKFFEQAHIKDMTAFLKIINNHKDELAWKRVLCLFRGIGPAKAIKIWEWVSNTNNPLKHIRGDNNQLFAQSVPGWNEFKRLISSLPLDSELVPSELIHTLIDSFYEDYLKDNYPNFKERILDVKQYMNLALQYKDLGKFLEDILLDADLTNKENNSKEEEETDQLILSTIHQAKGLEWQTVFVVSLAEERFPLERAYAEDSLEEERRLFYVACSRAKKELYLTVPMQEFTFWSGSKILRDSQFVQELPESCYEVWNLEDEEKQQDYNSEFKTADEL